jgi:hypothetical protein
VDVKFPNQESNWDNNNVCHQDNIRELKELLIKGIREAVPQSQNLTKAFNIQQGKEVKYIVHVISEGKRKINPERVSGIINMPLPKTKQDLRRFLGLIGYCRFWIDSYAPKTKDLYSKLLEKEPNPFLRKPKEVGRTTRYFKTRPCHCSCAVSPFLGKTLLLTCYCGSKNSLRSSNSRTRRAEMTNGFHIKAT